MQTAKSLTTNSPTRTSGTTTTGTVMTPLPVTIRCCFFLMDESKPATSRMELDTRVSAAPVSKKRSAIAVPEKPTNSTCLMTRMSWVETRNRRTPLRRLPSLRRQTLYTRHGAFALGSPSEIGHDLDHERRGRLLGLRLLLSPGKLAIRPETVASPHLASLHLILRQPLSASTSQHRSSKPPAPLPSWPQARPGSPNPTVWTPPSRSAWQHLGDHP